MLKNKVLHMVLAFSVAVIVAAGLVGCSAQVTQNPTPPPTASPTPSPITREKATILWSFWGDPWEERINERMIEVFEDEHPDIHVETLHEPWSTYFENIEAWWRDGPVPDVMFLDFVPIYASRGLLEPLDEYIQRDGIDLGDFYPGLLSTFEYSGSLYGLPRDNDTKVIFYNRALFDDAGLSYPEAGWTWNDLRETAIKLTKRDGDQTVQYGFAYEPDEWWRLWVWQNGGEVYDNDKHPTRTLMDSDEAIEAIQWLADLTNVDRVTPPYDIQNTSLGIGHLFQEGKLAMAFGNHALVPGFSSKPGLEWDVVGLPRREKQVNTAGGSGYVISWASQQKEAAWTFLKWLESPKGQAIFTESGVAVPSRRSVGEASIFTKQQPAHSASVFIEETERGRSIPMFEGCQEALALFNEAFVPVWRGARSAAQAVSEVTPKVDAFLGGR